MEAHAKAWERDRVLGGWGEASGLGLPEGQDRCLLAGVRKKLWLVEQMESSDKCGHKTWPCRATQRASNPTAGISTVLSVLGDSACLSDMTQETLDSLHILGCFRNWQFISISGRVLIVCTKCL